MRQPLDTMEIVKYQPRGNIREAFVNKSSELVLAGPAGTGKSRGMLEKVHLMLTKYDGARGLMVRKTRRSMTETCMFTYGRKVLKEQEGVIWRSQDQKFIYPNGSELVVCGMDKPEKVLSSEYDFCYANECTELKLEDWETISSRLRNGVIPYQQLLGDCNPDAPYHWLKQREKDGKLVMLDTDHKDNPVFWNETLNDWTEVGRSYVLGTLESLTGVRLARLRYGKWVGAEGIVYTEFDRNVHIIPRFIPPDDWERFWVIDFGYMDPFVWQEWVISPEGTLYLYREIYMTQRTVADHMALILEVTKCKVYKSQRPSAIVCDHDAEDRATVDQVLQKNGIDIFTSRAYKRIAPGLNAVKKRLTNRTLFIMEDSLVEIDLDLMAKKQPTTTSEEVESYVWDEKKRHGSYVPKDEYNHGQDCMRYAVAFVDDLAIDPQEQEQSAVLNEDERVTISPY